MLFKIVLKLSPRNKIFAYAQTIIVPKGDELPVRVQLTGGSGPARVWGHVKSLYSAGEMTEGPPCLANHESP